MREHLPIKTISMSSLEPHFQELIRGVSEGRHRVMFVDEDGIKISRVTPVTADGEVDIWAGYDPEAVRKAFHESAGILQGVDVEALLADLKAQR